MGEVPFIEIVPQLFVLEEKDLANAKQLMRLDLPDEQPGQDWVCPDCGTRLEGVFTHCWNCNR